MMRFFWSPRAPELKGTEDREQADKVRKVLGKAVGAAGTLVLVGTGEEILARHAVHLHALESDQVHLKTATPMAVDQRCRSVLVELITAGGLLLFQVGKPPLCNSDGSVLPMPFKVERQERRRFARALLDIPATMALPGAAPVSTRLENLSGAGAGVWSAQSFRQDQVVQLAFQFDDAIRFDALRCKVVRIFTRASGGWYMALRFLDLAEAEEAALVQVVYKAQIRRARKS